MQAPVSPAVSVVVPCYNSGRWLDKFVAAIIDVLEGRGEEFEIVLVNDASPDGLTWQAISEMATTDTRIVGVDLFRNVGQFAALVAGMNQSRGDVVVTIDDDFQHPPEEIGSLLDALADAPDIDCIVGRYDEKYHSWFRNLGSGVMDVFYQRAYGKPPGVRMSSFRAMRRPVVEGMLSFGTVRPVPGALLLQTTSRIRNVSVRHAARYEGSSGYRLTKLVSSTAQTILNASTAPLRIISLIGIALSGVSAFVLIYYLTLALMGRYTVAGFATIVTLVVFFGGATLFSVGLLGEYVARTVVEVERPPLYLIRSTTRDRPVDR